MTEIIKSLFKLYHYMNVEIADPRTQEWFTISSPWTTFAIIGIYLYFVQSFGPRWMANKKPFNLDRVMQIYNILQIGLSSYLLYEALVLGWLREYNFTCEPVDYSTRPQAVAVARAVFFYYMVKIVDLLDTIFFILRKKNNQVTFLHVYHHAGMVFGGWAATKYLAGGHTTFLGLINSFVHIVMYTHYLLTSLKLGGPWWKRYITQLQLVQFILILYHYAQLMWIDCGYPKWPALIMIPQNVFMIILFSDFYYKTYIKKNTKKVTTASTTATSDLNGQTMKAMNGKLKSQ